MRKYTVWLPNYGVDGSTATHSYTIINVEAEYIKVNESGQTLFYIVDKICAVAPISAFIRLEN